MLKPKKLWKVGDLVRHTGLTRQTIHNYTLLGLIRETDCTPSGHRLFDDTVFARLQRIERLKQRGMRLQEIAALLNDPRPRRRSSSETSQRPEPAGDRGDERADERQAEQDR